MTATTSHSLELIDEVVIPRRFNGPPTSANGGYACGLLAEAIGPKARVNLRLPPPLDVPLTRRRDADGSVRLLDGDRLVADGRKAEPSIVPPPPPALWQAEQAMERYAFADPQQHPWPTCFVCGPARRRGDGLRLSPGRVDGEGLHACVWSPDERLCDQTGEVSRRFLWAALDCPAGIAGVRTEGAAVLASMTVTISRSVEAGRPCIVTGWPIASEGRKHRAGAAVHTEDGAPVGLAETLWITLNRSRGDAR